MSKEWDDVEALERIETILMKEIPEEAMTDNQVRKLAEKIVNVLSGAQE
jgi:hypothetical protein